MNAHDVAGHNMSSAVVYTCHCSYGRISGRTTEVSAVV